MKRSLQVLMAMNRAMCDFVLSGHMDHDDDRAQRSQMQHLVLAGISPLCIRPDSTPQLSRLWLGLNICLLKIKKYNPGTFLAIQWLGLRASKAEGMDLIPDWGIKILHDLIKFIPEKLLTCTYLLYRTISGLHTRSLGILMESSPSYWSRSHVRYASCQIWRIHKQAVRIWFLSSCTINPDITVQQTPQPNTFCL